jgi:mono/diheme cytochrome c family protein
MQPSVLLSVLPIAAAALLSACAGAKAVPEPSAKHVEYAERNGYPAPLASLKIGRRLYISRCSDCHTLYNPAEYPHEEWPTIVRDMAENAEINEDQVREITRYVVAIAAAAQDKASPRPMGPPPSTP